MPALLFWAGRDTGNGSRTRLLNSGRNLFLCLMTKYDKLFYVVGYKIELKRIKGRKAVRMGTSIALSLMLLCSIGLIGGCGIGEKPATATEKYPEKPIALIVPFAAGGSADMTMRTMEKVITKYLGQPIVIKNVPGGGGTLGWNELVESYEDGYTIGAVSSSTLLQSTYGTTSYHYPSALDPLVAVTAFPVIAVVRADQEWNNMQEMIVYAKQHPSEVKYGHAGLGTANHVVGEMIKLDAKINIDQVPFKGESEIISALLGGHIQLIYTSPSSVQEYIKIGKVKALGVSTPERMNDPVFSNVPTFREQGLNVVFTFWNGIAAHKGMPKEIKAKLLAALEKTINDPEYIEHMKKLGMEVNYLGHEEFLDKWLNESEQLKKVVKETGIAEKIASQKN